MSRLTFVVPGRLDQLTGGYLFDRHIVAGLRARGRDVRVLELTASAFAAATLAELLAGAPTVVDGLAFDAFPGALAGQAARLRMVAFVHHSRAQETGLSRAAARQAALIEAALLPRFRGVICPSEATAAAVSAYGVPSERIAIVPPGTAGPKHLHPRRRGAVRGLLCVASLIPRKGHLILIEALARLRRLDWRLTCVGSLTRDPPTARAVRRRIAALGLGDRILLAGETSPATVARAYQTADAFVLPSYYEGYGMAYAEAMACGLPIVATDAGAIAETVPRAAGLLVAASDLPALVRALRRLLTDRALAARLAAGSHAAGRRLPDWPRATMRWEAACDRLAALAPPQAALEPAPLFALD
jgi:glycosyltransferase involved in cell wall biosynthesis